jgi:hypothetical protein
VRYGACLSEGGPAKWLKNKNLQNHLCDYEPGGREFESLRARFLIKNLRALNVGRSNQHPKASGFSHESRLDPLPSVAGVCFGNIELNWLQGFRAFSLNIGRALIWKCRNWRIEKIINRAVIQT